MAGCALSDASPLIAPARVDGLPWLRKLFGAVWVPQEVRQEVLPALDLPDERALLAAFERGDLRLCPATPTALPLPELDEGEAACIRLALADTAPGLLLMDGTRHRLGTRPAFGRHGRHRRHSADTRTDSLGQGGFARLHASDFRISAQVIATILRRVGE